MMSLASSGPARVESAFPMAQAGPRSGSAAATFRKDAMSRRAPSPRAPGCPVSERAMDSMTFGSSILRQPLDQDGRRTDVVEARRPPQEAPEATEVVAVDPSDLECSDHLCRAARVRHPTLGALASPRPYCPSGQLRASARASVLEHAVVERGEEVLARLRAVLPVALEGRDRQRQVVSHPDMVRGSPRNSPVIRPVRARAPRTLARRPVPRAEVCWFHGCEVQRNGRFRCVSGSGCKVRWSRSKAIPERSSYGNHATAHSEVVVTVGLRLDSRHLAASPNLPPWNRALCERFAAIRCAAWRTTASAGARVRGHVGVRVPGVGAAVLPGRARRRPGCYRRTRRG